MTVEELQAGLKLHDKGVLKHGSHKPIDREFCALEFVSVMHGEKMHDKPTHIPDLRRLNDAGWSSDKARTDAMLPVLAALWDWSSWGKDKQQAWAEHTAIETVRHIISGLPKLDPKIKQQCLDASDLVTAKAAAYAAAYAAADAAANIAYTADAAANAADQYLLLSASMALEVLKELNSPGVKWL